MRTPITAWPKPMPWATRARPWRVGCASGAARRIV